MTPKISYVLGAKLPVGVHHAHGWTVGQQHLEDLASVLGSAASEEGLGQVLALDFHGIESVSASYIRRTVLWLLWAGERFVSSERENRRGADIPAALNVFPVVTGLNDEIREELELVLEHQGKCCFEAVDWEGETIRRARLLGQLDPALRSTLRVVARLGQATAGRLHEQQKVETLGPTAWNNRLADLHARRLVQRRREGRQWVFETLTREILDG